MSAVIIPRFVSLGLLGALAVCALVLIPAASLPAGTLVFDNFDDDSGTLTNETTTTGGLTWLQSSKGETGGRPLSSGASFGQGGTVGAGDIEPGARTWRGNMVLLGQKLSDTPGTYVLGVDLKKFHQGGVNHEINVILRSSTQGGGRETVINYANDRLRTGGNWFNGLDIPTAFGTPGNIHVDLTLNLDPVGTNSGEISWFEIGNESNNGSAPLPAGPSGELMYDEIHLLTFSGSDKLLGYDNLSLTFIPEPSALALLMSAGLCVVGWRRSRQA